MLVSALILQDGGRSTHKIDDYVSRFRLIESMGIPTVLFLDQSLLSQYHFDSHVKVIGKSLLDLHPYAMWKDQGVGPIYRNDQKDRVAYLAIQNSKTLLMEEALGSSNRVSWVDFGIAHVLKQPQDSLGGLRRLPSIPSGILAPSAAQLTDHLDRVSWAFLGGFISMDAASLRDWNSLLVREWELCWPQASWEVNYWSRITKRYDLPVQFYRADHDDSILMF